MVLVFGAGGEWFWAAGPNKQPPTHIQFQAQFDENHARAAHTYNDI